MSMFDKSDDKVCSLCREKKKLTFEHIPPRGAFNSSPAKPVTGDKILGNSDRMPWDIEGLPYINSQRGMGLFSLCSGCNNNTGAWYADFYIEFSHIIAQLLRGIEANGKIPTGLQVNDVYMLRFIKQIISMFCSINNSDRELDCLREFVLDKEQTGIDKEKFRVCMYFTHTPLVKYVPRSVIFTVGEQKFVTLSEITAYPLGFLLYYNPKGEYKGIDITSFADYGYDVHGEVKFPYTCYEVNEALPEDYRTRDEIIDCIQKNTLD